MRRVVIKVGTHILTQDGEIAKTRMLNLVELIAKLKSNNDEIILVSSGAVGAGFTQLNLDKNSIANRQALASIGQPLLLKLYQEKFAKFNILCSQILLSADVFKEKEHIANARTAIDTLLKNSVVPIINENDTVSIEELVFGDNDRLSAHVAHYFDASILVILSDIDAYYDKDPRKYIDAKPKKVVTNIKKEELKADFTPNGTFATGGIVTKLQAGDFLLKNNREMFLASGFDLKDIYSFLINKKHIGGTHFKAKYLKK